MALTRLLTRMFQSVNVKYIYLVYIKSHFVYNVYIFDLRKAMLGYFVFTHNNVGTVWSPACPPLV